MPERNSINSCEIALIRKFQALLRPGRLDRVVYVPLPDLETRRQVLNHLLLVWIFQNCAQVLKVHTRKIPLATDVNLEEVAQSTEG